jgi:coiled-coil domain-containing protein 130
MQGFNMGRYVPPEHEGTISANKLIGKHALGNRAKNIGQGILTVRVEMPFPIWCTTCPKPTIIGQGVRFNAEKKKVGNYYTTPILSFRMKHIVCGGWIEIRTDPKNTAYVVTEGAKKRDTGEDKFQEGGIIIRTEAERERLQSDAFAALEVKIDDRQQANVEKHRIEQLLDAKDKDWEDPYSASQKLRRAFRAERKVRQKNEGLTEQLKDRMSLGMDLLEETEDDRSRASLVDFGDPDQGAREAAIRKAQTAPLFATTLGHVNRPLAARRETKVALAADARKEKLRQELSHNSRAAVDPFLAPMSSARSTLAIPRLKRKRDDESKETKSSRESADSPSTSQPLLVDYNSD